MWFREVTASLKSMTIRERISYSRSATSSSKTYRCLSVLLIPTIVLSAIVGRAIGNQFGNPILFVILAVTSTSVLMAIALTLLRFRLLRKYAHDVQKSEIAGKRKPFVPGT